MLALICMNTYTSCPHKRKNLEKKSKRKKEGSRGKENKRAER